MTRKEYSTNQRLKGSSPGGGHPQKRVNGTAAYASTSNPIAPWGDPLGGEPPSSTGSNPYPKTSFLSSSPEVSPKESRMSSPFGDHGTDIAPLDTSTGRVPAISRDPPSAATPHASWTGPSSTIPAGAFSGSFYDDTQENVQHSPSFRPGTARTAASDSPDTPPYGDDRRPSLASATTVSSHGSYAWVNGKHKKSLGFAGEDGIDPGSRQSSNSTAPTTCYKDSVSYSPRDRNNSKQTANLAPRPPSLNGSRPRSPDEPSSDVVPWLFQDHKDIGHYGDAPVRQTPTGFETKPPGSQGSSITDSSNFSGRLSFPGHRHSRSKEGKEEGPKSSVKSPIDHGSQARPMTSKDETQGGPQRFTDRFHSSMAPRSTPSTHSMSPSSHIGNGTKDNAQEGPVNDAPTGKRSIFDKFRRHKAERGAVDGAKLLPGSAKSLQDPSKSGKSSRTDSSTKKASREASVATLDSGITTRASDYGSPDSPSSRKESGAKPLHSLGKFPRPMKRGASYDNQAKDSEKTSLWNLDTNLSDMEGIISQPPPQTPPPGGAFTGPGIGPGVGLSAGTSAEERKDPWEMPSTAGPGAWDAPDSWAVKKAVDENMGRLGEIDEEGILPADEDTGVPHCVRVFRIDSTFATLSTSVNSTVSEILQLLGKKTFLQDDLDNYQIIMRKHDLSRQLGPGERPIAIQKRLFEQAGYKSIDRIEEIGREDNSYLVRFTFVPTKLSGFYSLEKDPGFGKMQKFSHVDLQGRSLVAIPITLYKKATEIISLNLSRNLALDVPKDFISSCINLREVRYISNEAWQLPPSLSLATRLTVLDISNNRLEHLEHSGLDKLQSLVSIKMSNNKLTDLPQYFGSYKALRSLNLSSNYFKEFPDFLCELKSLTDLDISFNSIKALSKVGQLSKLERLWATNNLLSGSFPENFSGLVNLKEIDVRFNGGISSVNVISQLPRLEQLMVGHNAISSFEGSFANKIRILHFDHNPMTRFELKSAAPTLTSLNLASANLSELHDSFYEKTPNLTKLNLDKNQIGSLSAQIGKLRRLEYLSVAKNPLITLPPQIGCLQELRFLDARECNISKLPSELWYCIRLDTLNVSANVLSSFPKFEYKPPQLDPSAQVPTKVNHTSSPDFEELGKLEDFGNRRPSQASSGLLSVGSSPVSSARQGSIVSVYGQGGRKASVISRTPTEGTLAPPATRKESNLSQRLNSTFAGSLRNLYMSDNRLNEDVFDEITLLPELRVLNLSWNAIYDIPQHSFRRWQYLQELHLSGNELTSLPSDDLEEVSSLKVLHLNANKFQTLPAELGKVSKLAILDVGSNSLKYNVSNWPYDWNWNWNRNLKYLNFSGNKRLEIKPSASNASNGGREGADLTNFNSLPGLRVLGLMDVTLTIPTVPDQTDDRRVRTSGSIAGSLAYGMADTLGKHEHLSTIDMVIPRFRGQETETLLGMFDGQALSTGGSRVAKFLHENFNQQFAEELGAIKTPEETPGDALRRTFLALNKDLATVASQSMDEREQRVPPGAHRGSTVPQTLSADDLNSGGVATVMFLDNMELFVANVGDAQAMLMHSDGGHKILTQKHDPAEPRERQRIREAGGYVSRQGKLNDVLEISRAFGYVQMMPAVMAAPSVVQITLREQDEMILIASRELWDYLTPNLVADMARSERGDLMRASSKLRDLAMAFGATGKIMVMMIGVSDLKKRERNRHRGQSLSMGPSQIQDDQIFPVKRGKRTRDGPDDSTLARLDQEVDPPVGELAIIFTDIKNSTMLWETYPLAMRAAIKTHNAVLRRQLRIIGGYEVKTEGDAFMVSFPTATSALLWTFSVQSHLLEAEWPAEILESIHGGEVLDADGNLIFRGLSVRMGMHWGSPVCEPDPITRRMDYFGPMVNRAARISSVADGGQITVSSDFIAEIQRTLEVYSESDRAGSVGSDDAIGEDLLSQTIRKELRSLSSQGFEVKDLGERKLKGLENPEFVYLMYPHSLAGRLIAQQQQVEAEAAAAMTRNPQLTIDTDSVWDLWSVSLRLEMLCSTLENPESTSLKSPETALLEKTKSKGGDLTDRFLVNFVEHQVSRIETCISTLALRHMVRPFSPQQSIWEQACPMGDIMAELTSQLAELKALKGEGAVLGAVE